MEGDTRSRRVWSLIDVDTVHRSTRCRGRSAADGVVEDMDAGGAGKVLEK